MFAASVLMHHHKSEASAGQGSCVLISPQTRHTSTMPGIHGYSTPVWIRYTPADQQAALRMVHGVKQLSGPATNDQKTVCMLRDIKLYGVNSDRL